MYIRKVSIKFTKHLNSFFSWIFKTFWKLFVLIELFCQIQFDDFCLLQWNRNELVVHRRMSFHLYTFHIFFIIFWNCIFSIILKINVYWLRVRLEYCGFLIVFFFFWTTCWPHFSEFLPFSHHCSISSQNHLKRSLNIHFRKVYFFYQTTL